ncbi:MAG: hypothetical protein QNK23_05235 [Crocinitomicaceae bacterium]|nr:hypothetical protein [Crocinitomicaceae bacterium]
MKITLNILLLFVLFQSSAQNLVPNGDFELGPDSSSTGWGYFVDTLCSNTVPVNGPDSWFSTVGSPDRMVEGTVFTCNWDLDTAQSGNAWIDFGYNEAGKTTLTSSVLQDSTYHLSAYLKHESFQGFATDTHRIAFVFNGGDSISSFLVVQSQNWQLFDTIFTATSNSTELTIKGVVLGFSGTKIDNLLLERINIASLPEDKLEVKNVIQIVDTMGRETEDRPNTLLIYVYSDGTSEKVFRVE